MPLKTLGLRPNLQSRLVVALEFPVETQPNSSNETHLAKHQGMFPILAFGIAKH
jgi:hypothetical protein